MYAMGWTQHTVGVQNIRTMSIIQLLLGNMGVAGGGVNALRGESNVQGSTDHCLLYHILPGYLKTPKASLPTLSGYNAKYTPQSDEPKSLNWWKNYPKYVASLLRANYGTGISLEDAYSYLPKLDDGKDYSWLSLFDAMYKEKFTGFFAWGQNPACSGASSNKTRQAMGKLDWMVNVNIFDSETGSFWKGPDMDPKKIKTEVFMLPCSASIEKEGSITNSGRWMQWRYKAVDSPGVAMPDGEIITELYYKIKELYEEEGGPLKEAIAKMTWDYGPKGADGKIRYLDTHYIAKEIKWIFSLKIKRSKESCLKKAPSFPVSLICRMTGPPLPETGSTVIPIPRRETWRLAGAKRMNPVSVSIPNGRGAGRSTAGLSITVLPLIRKPVCLGTKSIPLLCGTVPSGSVMYRTVLPRLVLHGHPLL